MLEETSPGTKQQMYFGLLKKAAARFAEDEGDTQVVSCAECGAPTIAYEGVQPRCSFCKTKSLALVRKEQGVPAPRPHRRKKR